MKYSFVPFFYKHSKKNIFFLPPKKYAICFCGAYEKGSNKKGECKLWEKLYNKNEPIEFKQFCKSECNNNSKF